ncbi:MAG: DUF4328 domain-containing protein [Candidatus Zixiibacteriota bacterium]
MSNWYHAKDGEPVGPFTDEQFLKLYEDGQIKRATKVWKEGTEEWTTLGASDLIPRTSRAPRMSAEFNRQPQLVGQFGSLPQVATPQYMGQPEFAPRPQSTSTFRLPFNDLGSVTGTLNTLLYIAAGLAAIAMVSDALQYRLLHSFASGTMAQVDMKAAADSNDSRQAFIRIAQILLYGGIGITFLFWVNQANKNLRALGAERLRFTSGWAVGWWFVPIASLVRPYQIMAEISKGSQDPERWELQTADTRIGLWWFGFLAMEVFRAFAYSWGANATTLSRLSASTVVSILANIAAVISALLAAQIIAHIWSHQRAHRYSRNVTTSVAMAVHS